MLVVTGGGEGDNGDFHRRHLWGMGGAGWEVSSSRHLAARGTLVANGRNSTEERNKQTAQALLEGEHTPELTTDRKPLVKKECSKLEIDFQRFFPLLP